MKPLKLLLALSLSLGLFYFLNNVHPRTPRDIPPLGKLMNPFYGFWQNASSLEKGSSLDFSFPEMEEEVQVQIDERGVPHIFAKNDRDANFVQGYITAKDRLWQMDFATRATAGRLSEVIGLKDLGPFTSLDYDKKQRRLGFTFAAENAIKGWKKNQEQWELLLQYCKGVNAYINQLSPAEYPLEYKLLNIQPEEWTPIKTAYFIKSMANTLAGYEEDLEFTNALAFWGNELFAELYPAHNTSGKTIVPEGSPWDFEPIPFKKDSLNFNQGTVPHTPLSKPDKRNGSNNWAISPAKSASKNAILCSDPHLGLTLPSIWYEIQISTPYYNAYGVSLPGVPNIIIGFNENIAWGQTNTMWDVKDWYKIKWSSPDKSTYSFQGEDRKTSLRIEEITIKGRDEVVRDTVIYTHFGPIVYNDKNHPNYDLALRWMAHDESKPEEIAVFGSINKASDFSSFKEAVHGFMCPAQNFAYADIEGNVGLVIGGSLPLRNPGSGRFVLDGSDAQYEWQGVVPTEHLPMVFNPERGFISSSNQSSTDDTYPYEYWGNFLEYRDRSIFNILSKGNEFTVEDMKEMQADVTSAKAKELIPLFLSLIDTFAISDKENQLLSTLKKWDYRYDINASSPVLFENWKNLFFSMVNDEVGTQSNVAAPENWKIISFLQNDIDHIIFDQKKTPTKETGKDLVMLSLQKVAKSYDPSLTLGDVRKTNIPHILRIPGLGEMDLLVDGDSDCINANKNGHGPSWRMVVEMGSEINAYGVYPGGQSGNPGSPNYADQVDEWQHGKYFPLNFLKEPSTDQNNFQNITFSKSTK